MPAESQLKKRYAAAGDGSERTNKKKRSPSPPSPGNMIQDEESFEVEPCCCKHIQYIYHQMKEVERRERLAEEMRK
ncbi:hypothetical protein DMENIID0001_029580 [Sergentomyia squamirostris]